MRPLIDRSRRMPGAHGRSCRAARFAGLALLVWATACGRNEYAPPPPPPVTVARPVVQDVTRYAEFTGTTRAVESVEVRARVKGFLQSMHFEPGQMVEQGALLFVVDPEPFEVALQAAQAELASNRAEHDLAQTEFERRQTMFKRGATSELDLIRARASRDKSQAAVANAEAAVHAAQLDLDYAHVRAPIPGRVGRHLVDLGNLVGADGATHLTDIVRYSPLYVYFYLSERDFLSLQRLSREARGQQGAEWEDRPPTRIEVAKADDDGFPHTGVVDFTALEIDAGTGTFEARGVLENAGELDEVIVPGTFVRVRVPIEAQPGALLVPERAVGSDQSGRFLLVVDSENVVEQRSVELGALLGQMRIVRDGIRADDWVIVNGLQRARPGAEVRPTPADDAGVDGEAAERPPGADARAG